MPGSVKCPPACTCVHHTAITGRRCLSGCTCGRHALSVKKRIGELTRARQLGKECSAETRREIGDRIKAARSRNNWPTWNKGLTKDTHPSLARASTKKLEWWADPVKRQRASEQMAQRRAAGVYNISPNQLERLMAEILPQPWSFTGNRGLAVGNRCPDFWDGGTRVIEVFGDYWHAGHDPQMWIDHYAGHGYQCFVIWESEVESGQVGPLLEFAA